MLCTNRGCAFPCLTQSKFYYDSLAMVYHEHEQWAGEGFSRWREKGWIGEEEEEEERPMGNPVPAIVSPHPIRLLMTPPSSSSLSFSTHPTPKQHLSLKLPSIPIAKYFAPN